MSYEERNLLSVGYRNAVAQRRSAWRAISSTIDEIDDREKATRDNAHEYRRRIETELNSFCSDVIKLLDEHCLPSAQRMQPGKERAEAIVFFKKMKGDYYRYNCEYQTDQK